MNINTRISPDLDSLSKYNRKYSWIPGPNNIRPNDETIKAKNELLGNIQQFYLDISDYIFSEVFKYPVIFINGKLKAINNDYLEYKFVKNKFPYNLPKNVNHYILWYNRYNNITDSLINKAINTSLKAILNHNNYKYVWYENPKMNIPGIYHLQVFWIESI